MVGDRISNLINDLKTASIAGKESVIVPNSKMSVNILNLLKKENYVADYSIKGNDKVKEIVVNLKYEDGEPAIHDAKRLSKQSSRTYRSASNIRSVRRGYGLLVVTTPKGVISGETARKQNVGGEVLFEIW